MSASPSSNGKPRKGVRVIAILEASKGILALAAGLGLLSLIHQDLALAVERFIWRMHLNPTAHYPKVLIKAAQNLDNYHLVMIAVLVLVYALVRFIEAYGLWWQRGWAEWFATLSGAIYIPIEVMELIKGFTWPRITALAINLLIVGYLSWVLWESKRRMREARSGERE
jgi:uncharacterized membrane protein (DUF2068 family)